MIDLISSITLSVMRSFSISSGDVTIFMLRKVLTVGDLIFSKKNFIRDTRRPGVCGLFIFFFS